MSRRIERVAHRGSPRERVENTIDSFLLAMDHGADALELDVHCTADREVVVFHDDMVQGRPVSSMSWSDARQVDLGRGARIPLLHDVLEFVGDRAKLYVELKGVGIEREVLTVLQDAGRRYAVHSFDHGAIERMAGLAPDIARGILLDRGISRPAGVLADSVRRTGAVDVWPHWTLVDDALVTLAHELGTRVIPWTVNSPQTAEALARAGVDGICTDDVRLLASL